MSFNCMISACIPQSSDVGVRLFFVIVVDADRCLYAYFGRSLAVVVVCISIKGKPDNLPKTDKPKVLQNPSSILNSRQQHVASQPPVCSVRCNPPSEGILSHVPGSTSCGLKRKSRTDDAYDVFDKHSQLCARNVLPRCSSSSQDAYAFERYSQLCAMDTTVCSQSPSSNTVITNNVRNAQSISNDSIATTVAINEDFIRQWTNITSTSKSLGKEIILDFKQSPIRLASTERDLERALLKPRHFRDDRYSQSSGAGHQTCVIPRNVNADENANSQGFLLTPACTTGFKTAGSTLAGLPASSVLIHYLLMNPYVSYVYDDLGDSDQRCHHYGAAFWFGERLKGEPLRFLQLYIYDTEHELENRMQHFSGLDNNDLDPEIVQGLIHFLDTHNELVQLFRTAHDRCQEINIPEFYIRLYNGDGARGYELQASNTLRAIFFDSELTGSTEFDVVIEHRGGLPKRINKLHKSYMPLQFPLLFIYEQSRFQTELKLKRADGSEYERRVTMLAYYAYQLPPWVSEYNLIFRVGRLFQQYLDYMRPFKEESKMGLKLEEELSSQCLSQGASIYIRRYMADYPELSASDRLDIVCRVFEQKIKVFLNFLKTQRIFETVTGVEFQKRGLPHCYTLLWVDSASKIQEPEDVDRLISAELPDPQADPQGYKVVSEMMIHEPYDAANMSVTCMQGDKCTKGFPKKFTGKTFFDDNGHVHYQRRDTGVSTMKHQLHLDNSNVVPYNYDLLLAFQTHINVEYCGWSMLIKYLFKYISKGADIIFARVSRPLGESSNAASSSRPLIYEIQNYLEGRFVCPQERITFRDRDRLESIVNLPGRKSTTLTEWFTYNAANEDGRNLTYLDFPSEFVWYDDRKSLSPRQNSKSSVGRLVYVHPTSAACEALGLLGDNNEWDIAMKEACASATSSQLRFVFAHILAHCEVTDPLKLWTKLGPPPPGLLDMLANRLLMEERNYNEKELQQQKAKSVPKLNAAQRKIYDLIINATATNQQELIFVYGHGGTGKTFLWKTIISALRSGKKFVLAVTSSGGDFWQTLLVKKGASKIKVIASCISESELWPHFRVFTLKENMRLSRPDVSADERDLISSFALWLLDIRDGKIGEPDQQDLENTSWIDIPHTYCLLNN
ncbi:DNA helicase [Tanacetum coccineum]